MKTAATLTGYVAVALAALLAVTWVVMILVGVWHAQRNGIPAIGFGESMLLVFIASILTGSGAAAKQ
ncbi:hypothetical protein [Streptomyces sp. NPDC055099]